jgi:hypothetical protein
VILIAGRVKSIRERRLRLAAGLNGYVPSCPKDAYSYFMPPAEPYSPYKQYCLY